MMELLLLRKTRFDISWQCLSVGSYVNQEMIINPIPTKLQTESQETTKRVCFPSRKNSLFEPRHEFPVQPSIPPPYRAYSFKPIRALQIVQSQLTSYASEIISSPVRMSTRRVSNVVVQTFEGRVNKGGVE